MQECVSIMKDFVCANPWLKPEERRKTMMAKFQEQFQRFRITATEPKTPHSIPRVTVSGKIGNDNKISGSHQDDLMVALCMNLYLWEQLITRTISHFNYRRVFGF